MVFIQLRGIIAAPSPWILQGPLGEEFLHLVTSQNYQGALKLSDSLAGCEPYQPEGYFLKIIALNNLMIDYEDTTLLSELNKAEDSLFTLCQNRLAEDDKEALFHYYLGVTIGYRMVGELRKRNFIKAYQLGSEAAERLKRAISLKPDLYDAYVGLGNYYYFRSRFSGILRSLGIVPDQREDGIRYLELAATRGCLSRWAALSSLAWIAIDKKDYNRAIAIADSLLTLYPQNRAFLWCLGHAQWKAERWDEALETYQRLLVNLRALNRNNHYNEVGCLHAIAQIAAQKEDWELVYQVASEALQLKLSPELVQAKKKDLKNLKTLKEKAERELRNIARFPNHRHADQ